MTQSLAPFRPSTPGSTVNLAVVTTTANVQVTPKVIGNGSVRIANVGTNVVFLEFGDGSGTAATLTTSWPMMPNSVETFFFEREQNYVAAIASATGNTIYVTSGVGA